ncbi:hypothetical protein LJC60_06290 [Ruminococcaceae bacterium OttesenSCG-928-D13]|nr:hypothetical protein [Ruminococcaceae bacterium OttesenSCG-928-D13]
MRQTPNYGFEAPELMDRPDVRPLSRNWQKADETLTALNGRVDETMLEVQKVIAAAMVEINRILSEGMIVTDPVSLLQVPVQTALANLYGLHKAEGGLTADEYAALGMTVDAYRAKGLTAIQYATQGKKLLGG